MTTDLNALFNMQAVETSSAATRLRFAATLRAAVSQGTQEIVCVLNPHQALQLAREVEFAISCNPLGVPEDFSMPLLDLTFHFKPLPPDKDEPPLCPG